MSIQVTGNDVAEFFGRSGEALRKLRAWSNLRGKEYVAEKVLSHKSSAIFEIEPEAIRHLDTEHPLGDLRESYEDTVQIIRDWRPDFAFSHLFHFCAEDLGRIYSYQEFRDEWSTAQSRESWLREPVWEIRRTAEQRLIRYKGYTEPDATKAVRSALRWRIGTAYYSFLREIYTVSKLRRLGLEAFAHPLADALFRTDMWCNDTVVEIYIENPRYRREKQGRKHRAQQILGDQNRFDFVTLQMAKPTKYGSVELPTDEEIDRCARAIRATNSAQ
ncbi:hypothetical protein [Nocardia blacklockiae]|uniref:hypothetical protein n=1 Tax=Nocardia blacklockiae TaxID=480036 RepID=UPI0018949F01|nr:hypothetical protein [Nocardia blacklockiae]MBF6173674.1 hypothetical protein [Nocardia blacklockiae]